MARIWSEAAIAASIAEAERAHEATEAARERYLGSAYKRRERAPREDWAGAKWGTRKVVPYGAQRGGSGKRHGASAPFAARRAY